MSKIDDLARSETQKYKGRRNALILEAAISCYLENNMKPEEVAEILEEEARLLRNWE